MLAGEAALVAVGQFGAVGGRGDGLAELLGPHPARDVGAVEDGFDDLLEILQEKTKGNLSEQEWLGQALLPS